jgi:SAM-dependent methyltransferase
LPRDPQQRFTDRVDAYVRFRPSYPPAVLDLLASECGLDSPRVVADIGSGTGILTRLLLEQGHTVHAVEPNLAMRQAAESSLAEFDSFHSVDGSAEKTTLADDSIHLVASAQAFHWFDRAESRTEFQRILRPGGRVAILWNDRRKSNTPFLRAYEELLLKHGIDYELVDHSRIGQQELTTFFGPWGFTAARFDNHQILDFEALQGRTESSSYMPRSGTPGHPSMLRAIEELFETHNEDGTVSLDYDTLVFYGRLS